MPRQITETLAGYTIGLDKRQVPKIADDGQVLFDRDGQPRTEQLDMLLFLDVHTGHVVQIPLGDKEKRTIVELLPGGVVLPG